MSETRVKTVCLPDLSDQAEQRLQALEGHGETGLSLRALAASLLDSGEPVETGSPDDARRRVLYQLEGQDPEAVSRWRGLLAWALLHDLRPEGIRWSVRTADSFGSESAKTLRDMIPQKEWKLLVLDRAGESWPLGFADGRRGLTPAAEPLPPWPMEETPWYHNGFRDPCALLDDPCAAILAKRLRRMLDLPQLESGARRLLEGFLSAVEDFLAEPEAQLTQIGSQEAQDLAVRLEAALGLQPMPECVQLRSERIRYSTGGNNALLQALELPDGAEEAECTLWRWRDIPFAMSHGATVLRAAGGEAGEEALTEIREELDRLREQAPDWNEDLARALEECQSGREGLTGEAKALIRQCRERAERAARKQRDTVHLTWPWAADSPSARRLLAAYGKEALAPFATRLFVMPECPESAVGDNALRAHLVVWCEEAARVMALPPLSSAFTALQSRLSAAKADAAGRLIPDSLSFAQTRSASGDSGIRFSMTLAGGRQLVLDRVYSESEMRILNPEEIPNITLWPGIPLPPESWKAYHLLWEGPGDLEMTAFAQGENVTAAALEGCMGSRLSAYPDFLLLRGKNGEEGALPNALDVFVTQARGPALAALDLGAGRVAAALRLGDETAPLSGYSMQRTLLCGDGGWHLPWVEFNPIYPAAVRLAPQRKSAQASALLDAWMPAALRPGEQDETLRSGLKWSIAPDRDACLRLLFSQLTLMMAFHARMKGASSLSWRFAYPDSMAWDARKRLRVLLEDAAREAARLSGLPVTPGVPAVACATECGAEIAAFRAREDGNFRSGLMTLDLGTATLDLCLWLRGMQGPLGKVSVPLSAATLLSRSLLSQGARWTEELPGLREVSEEMDQDLRDVLALAAASAGQPMGLGRVRDALDRWLTAWGEPAVRWLGMRYYEGRCPLLMAILLYSLSGSMLLAGQMLEQAYQQTLVNDLLPETITIGLSGGGALTMAALDAPFQNRLGQFLRLPMSAAHPCRGMRLALTLTPKLEVALGLLQIPEMEDLLPEDPRRTQLKTKLPLSGEVMAAQFLRLFFYSFPQAAERLFPGVMQANGMLSPQAEAALLPLAETCVGQPTTQPLQSGYAMLLDMLLQRFAGI